MDAGSIVKGYELRERIGTGGFGAVYRAFQSTVGREVAIKIIIPRFANHPDFIRRFETEAQLIARLEHPYITPLYDYWRDPDGAYLVMRWLKGGNLREALQQGPFAPEPAALVLDQICAALSVAHRVGIVHRDIKPANILLDEDGNCYLADFGIAKDSTSLQAGHTEADAIVGSPDYIAPEQARSEPVTPATDIYSLGVTLYEILTAQHPFPDLTPVERLFKHLNDPLPLITNLNPDVMDAINTVIQKATAKNPALRYGDVLELAAAFRDALGMSRSHGTSVIETLTQREYEILQFIVEGRSNKEIAQDLFITIGTVKWYIRQIYGKLGVRSRVQAIVRARELNLIGSHANEQTDSASSLHIDLAPENPYKGLHAFTAADHRDYFGREKLTDKLIKKLGDVGDLSRFLAIVGPSGSGKSSLVKAGLIPAVWRGALPNSEKWFVVEMLPGSLPLDELEVALTKVAADHTSSIHEQLERDQNGLLRVASLILPNDGSELLLVIDQFEEVFTLVDDEQKRQHFLNLIYAAVTAPRSRVRVVVTLRADFYDRPLHYPEFGELMRSRMETVLPLSADELERAIAKPAESVGIKFEPGLVASIVSEVNYQSGALPLLQYALTELFEHRNGRTLTREAYQTIGGTVGALAKRADEIYLSLNEAGQEAARQMFLRLVTLGEGTEDMRRRVPRSELLAITLDTDLMDELIDTYSEYRLFSLDNDPGTRVPTVEVAHEAILREWERLRNWLNEGRDDVRLQRQVLTLASEWHGSKQDTSFLLRGSRLDVFEKWMKETQLALTKQEREFLEGSLTQRIKEETDEEKRQARELKLAQDTAKADRRAANRLRMMVAVFVLATLLSIPLTVSAWNNASAAEQARAASEANAAESQHLALVNGAQAALLSGNTDLALALAWEANRGGNASSQAQIILAQAAYAPGTMRRFTGHTDVVLDVAFSPNGHLAASASADNTIYVWDIVTGEVVQHLQGHYDDVMSVAFRPDGRTLLSSSGDTTLILWDIETGEQIRRFRGHAAWINSAALSADGQRALSCSDDGTMILWNIDTGEQIQRFRGHTGSVTSAAFHPDGRRVLSSSWEGTVRLWDIETGETLRVYDGQSGPLKKIALSPDGNTFLVAPGNSANVLMWDTESGEMVHTLQGHGNTIRTVAFHPNGRLALSGSWDNTMILWDVETGQVLHRFLGHTNMTTSVAFSPDGRYAISGSWDRTVRLWDLQGGQIIRRFQPENAQSLQWIREVQYSPDGRYALTSSVDGISILWDVAAGREIRRFEGAASAFTADGNIGILGTGGGLSTIAPSGRIALVNLATGEEIEHFDYDAGGVRDFASAPDGETFAASYSPGYVSLMSSTTGEVIRTFTSSYASEVLAFSPDGSLIAGSTNGGDVSLWDANTGQLRSILEGHTGQVAGVTFSPDNTILLASSYDMSVTVWDIQTGTILHRFTDHNAITTGAALSSDGRLATTGSADRTFIIWDVQTGEAVSRFTDLRSAVYSVAFSPDGYELLVAYVDGTVELWRIDTPDEVLAWTLTNRYIPELTCDQRELYRLEPLCAESITP